MDNHILRKINFYSTESKKEDVTDYYKDVPEICLFCFYSRMIKNGVFTCHYHAPFMHIDANGKATAIFPEIDFQEYCGKFQHEIFTFEQYKKDREREGF